MVAGNYINSCQSAYKESLWKTMIIRQSLLDILKNNIASASGENETT